MAAIVTAAVVGAVSLGYSAYQGEKARKEQRKANAKAERIEALASQREKASALRQNRIRAAQITASAAASNLTGASAVQGSLASLFSQEASNGAFTNQVDTLNAQRLQYLNRADSYEGRATLGSAVARVAASIPKIGG